MLDPQEAVQFAREHHRRIKGQLKAMQWSTTCARRRGQTMSVKLQKTNAQTTST